MTIRLLIKLPLRKGTKHCGLCPFLAHERGPEGEWRGWLCGQFEGGHFGPEILGSVHKVPRLDVCREAERKACRSAK